MKLLKRRAVKVADEVWIAAALLHRENSDRSDFTVKEIVERAKTEGIGGELRPGVYVHAVQHCVANRSPNPGRYRMLVETAGMRRRLFRKGDVYHPSREGAKIVPAKEEIPAEYHCLLDWYSSVYTLTEAAAENNDPILGLRGLGKEIWAGEDPDSYVSRLRQDWS